MIWCLSQTGRTRREGEAEEVCGFAARSADGGSSVGGEGRSAEVLGSGTGRKPNFHFFLFFLLHCRRHERIPVASVISAGGL